MHTQHTHTIGKQNTHTHTQNTCIHTITLNTEQLYSSINMAITQWGSALLIHTKRMHTYTHTNTIDTQNTCTLKKKHCRHMHKKDVTVKSVLSGHPRDQKLVAV
jgi:hypothetical protein